MEDKKMSSFGITCKEAQERAYKGFKEMAKVNNEEEVDHPQHYNQGIEAIDYIESHNLNFSLGNAIKYITRCEHKEDKLNDLEKAIWYIEREIERESGQSEHTTRQRL